MNPLKITYLVVTAFLTPCLVSGPAIEQANFSSTVRVSHQFEKVRTLIIKELVDNQIPSMAVAVSQKDKVLWEQAFGWADRENRVPATEHTIYPIGSVAKPVTATGLMLLVQRGVIQLDQPVNKYLNEPKLRVYVGDANQATVRRLANHSSGLARYATNIYADEPYELPTIEESIRRYGHLLREPGETYEYSNFGYNLLAHLIERTSEKSFDQFMRTEVFLPLGMTHTAVGMGQRLEKFYAVRYSRDQKPFTFHFIKPDYPGAGGIYSSVHDLLRFGMFHLRYLREDQKKILGDKQIIAMQEPSVAIAGINGFGLRNNSYGIGWSITPDRYGYRQIFHSGHDGYATALLTMLPGEDICVVVLINGGPVVSVVDIADGILATLLPKYAERVKQPTSRIVETQPHAQTYKPTKLYLGHWTGSIQTYVRSIPIDMWFQESGDIHVQMRGQVRTLLSGARIENGYLRGSFNSDIGTDDANRRRPYNLHVKLKHRGNVLNGSITAVTLPGHRAGEILSHWIELKRVAPDRK